MRDWLIQRLFALLGHSYTQQHGISYLFGATTTGHDARKKRWELALARLYRDKDLLDFLFYQAESDKENIFKGKIATDLARGARLRTLFIVFSARRAYLKRRKRSNAQEQVENDEELRDTDRTYKHLTDIHSSGHNK